MKNALWVILHKRNKVDRQIMIDWTNLKIERFIDRQMDKQIDRQIDGQINIYKDRQTKKMTSITSINYGCSQSIILSKERLIDNRNIDRQIIEIQIDRQMDRQIDRQIDRCMNKNKNRNAKEIFENVYNL